MSRRRTFVVGVGMTKFEKPGRREGWDYPDMVKEAGSKALLDAGITFEQVDQVVAGYVYGDSCSGQRAVYLLGMTGVPIYNVNNNCATGSSALFLAKQFVESGLSECALAVGFEKMERGSLKTHFNDRTNPLDRHMNVIVESGHELQSIPFAPQMFGNAGREHIERYGTTPEQIAKIAEKNHRHSVNNPYSQFRDVYTLDQVLNSPKVFGPLTKLQCCPTSDGSAVAVVVSEDFVRKHNLQSKAVEIVAMAMTTDFATTFSDKSCIKMVGAEASKAAADKVYREAGITPNDVQVIELHDCFSANELVTYEALGLCGEGQAGKLIDSGNVTYGGKWVVNPSGGLISKGHPLGATGLAQCSELCWQLRQMAGPRQVPNVKYALQHNIGLGGAAVVGLYRLGFPEAVKPLPQGAFNPAIDASFPPALSQAAAAPAAGKCPYAGRASLSSNSIDAIFESWGQLIQNSPDLVKKVDGAILFKVSTKDGSQTLWIADLKGEKGSFQKLPSPVKPDCVISINEEDFIAVAHRKLDLQKAFLSRKMKIEGSLAPATRFAAIINATPTPKL